MHHLHYLQLTCYAGLALGVLRLLARLAIKMIAIFASETISARAFKILKMDQRERRLEISRARLTAAPAPPVVDAEEQARTADPAPHWPEPTEETGRKGGG